MIIPFWYKKIEVKIMFEPWRCEGCVHGYYDEREHEWDCNIGCWSIKECEEHYEDDERT